MTKNTIERANERARLESILVAALSENDDWRVLTELALSAGNGALAQRFAQALAEERRHLANVRAWCVDTWSEDATPSERMRAASG